MTLGHRNNYAFGVLRRLCEKIESVFIERMRRDEDVFNVTQDGQTYSRKMIILTKRCERSQRVWHGANSNSNSNNKNNLYQGIRMLFLLLLLLLMQQNMTQKHKGNNNCYNNYANKSAKQS